jgi:hypothetical protein
MSTPQHPSRLPWWWFLPYVVVLLLFTGMIAVLIVVGVTPLVAVGVPAGLSTVTVSALTRIAALNPAVHSRAQVPMTSPQASIEPPASTDSADSAVLSDSSTLEAPVVVEPGADAVGQDR